MYVIKREQLPVLLERIHALMDLFVPVNDGKKTDFALFDEHSKVDLSALRTAKSAKDIFFPQSEDLYRVRTGAEGYRIETQALCDRPFAVFGIRACDIRGLQILDMVFRSEPYDSFYCARRDNGLLIGLACSEPEETCFCSIYGIDAAEPEADIKITFTADEIYWDVHSQKGQELTDKIRDLFNENDGERCLEEKEKIHQIMNKLPYKDLSLEGWGTDALYERFASPVWDKIYKTCLACGTCTFVCPTCQCYDIRDFKDGRGVRRYRCWDSCMYSDFTLMAGGNNRKTQKERYRQRFMHKLAYFPANNNGVFSCVGCGRCVVSCPSSLHIIKVIRAFAEDKKNETR